MRVSPRLVHRLLMYAGVPSSSVTAHQGVYTPVPYIVGGRIESPEWTDVAVLLFAYRYDVNIRTATDSLLTPSYSREFLAVLEDLHRAGLAGVERIIYEDVSLTFANSGVLADFADVYMTSESTRYAATRPGYEPSLLARDLSTCLLRGRSN